MATPTTNSERKRFALLIGIDYYSACETCLNLSGCVNDVQEMEKKLLDELNVPRGNIRTVLGPKPEGDPSGWQPPTWPTRDDVLKEIKDITSSAQEGDFVYFHYSGHGCRASTECNRKKDAGIADDEALSLVGTNIIRDFELGALFAEIKAKGIILLAILDCCHSGGATRIRSINEPRIRSRGFIEHPADAEWLQPRPVATDQAPGRDTKKVSNWFYHEPGYHFIAACQANQEAREASEVGQGNQLAMGDLTFSLIEALGTYRTSMFTTSYRALEDWLLIRFRARRQKPLVFGNYDQIIFDLANPLEFKQPHPGQATVIKTLTKTLWLDRGRADAIQVGDEYQIFSPSETRREGTNFVAQVVIHKLSLFESSARLVEGCLDNVEAGWWAKRISRQDSHTTKIVVEPLSDHNDKAQRAIEKLRDEWTQHTDPANVPLKLHFDGDRLKLSPAYRVRVSKTLELEILDEAGKVLRNMPQLIATDERMVEKLIAQLTHLQMYQVVMDLKPASADEEFRKRYEFSITEDPYKKEEIELEEEGQGSPILGCYDIDFKNVSSENLYVTILSLSTLRGVHKDFPTEGGGSHLVESGKSIAPAIELRIFKNDFFDHKDCFNKGTKMVDTLKILVTLEPHNFDHFLLHNLDQDAMDKSKTKEWASRSTRTNVQGKGRDTKITARTTVQKPEEWDVKEHCITTVIA